MSAVGGSTASVDGGAADAAREANGRWRMHLALTDRLRLALASADPGWEAALAPRYAPFFDPGAQGGRLQVRLETREIPPLDGALLSELSGRPIERELEGGRLLLSHPRFEIELSRDRGRARLDSPRHRFAFDALVRHLFAEEPGSLLMHGTVLVAGDRGWIAAGDSGRGKSTLAELLPEWAYCDELGLVEETRTGWRVRSTPFWHGRPGNGRLQALHLLEHGTEHRALPLSPAESVRRIARQIVWPDWRRDRAEAALERLGRLVREIPVYRLVFRPDRGVFSVIEGVA